MGTWGPGNLDSDAAEEHLIIALKPWLEQITRTMSDPALMELDEYDSVAALVNLELLVTLAEGLGAEQVSRVVGMPAPETLARWRSAFLEVYDATIDELSAKPDFKRRRREVIEATFARAAQVAKREHSDP